MNRFLKRANARASLGNAAALLIVISLVGQVLGFMRYKLINANFSAIGPQSTDAYFAAVKIPDLFFFTLAAGALGVAFMPILAEHMNRGDKKGVWELSNSLINLLSIVMLIAGVIMIIFAKPIIHKVVAPGLPPEQLNNAATIMRLIALNPMLFAISGVLTSVQQTYGRFVFYALAPIGYNLAIIVSIFAFRNNIGLIGLGVGALIGAVLQLIIVLFGLPGISFRWRPKIMWRNKDFKLILRNLPPRSIDQGIDSINSIVETNLAARIGLGNITFYENAYILSTTPVLLVGTAIATAAFPRLNDRLAQHRPDLFRKEFLQILRAMIWIAMPMSIVCYFARGYFARLIFTTSAPEIALIFGFLAGAIFFRTLYAIISRWFYAQKDTVTPLLVSIFTIALNVYLAITLSRPNAYGIAGLAMAQSIVAAVEVAILFIIMLSRDRKLFNMVFWSGVLKITSVTGFSVLAAFIMISFFPLSVNDKGFITLGFKLATITGVTFAIHVGVSALFGLEEVRPVVSKTRQIFKATVKI
ncbi:MAG: lipid II flippase MurJ [Candidatus Saccharimonadales bacterium]